MPYRCITQCYTGNRLWYPGDITAELPNEDCERYFVPYGGPVDADDLREADPKHQLKMAKKKEATKKGAKSDPVKDELVKRARELGINAATSRWSVEALEKNIAEAEASQPEPGED